MKTQINLIVFMLLLGNIAVAQQITTEFPSRPDKYRELSGLTGAYLGQKPPGMEPELFAPGLLSTVAHEHSSPTFSPDGNEVYFSVYYPGVPIEVIMFCRLEEGDWTKPEVASFSGQYRDGQPTFSPDGSKLFYCSTRPQLMEENPTRMTLWCVEKLNNKWGQPFCLDAMVNSGTMEMTLSVAQNGNVYFSACDSVRSWTLHKMEFKDGIYTPPKSCGKLLSANYAEWCPYISPDETYMLFSAYHLTGEENNDIYIVFKDESGEWTKAINIGSPVNSVFQEQFPRVSNDGKYLFFTSNQLKVEKKINHNYKFNEPLTYQKIENLMNQPGNGKGDIYWVSAKIIDELKPKH